MQAAAESEKKLRENLEASMEQETQRLTERRQALEAAHLAQVQRWLELTGLTN